MPARTEPQTAFSPADAVSVEGVSFSRRGETVLENITLHVARGDFWALIGPNGGGKTTLLRVILGLITPDAGRVRVFGAPPAKARTRIGYVPQFSTIRQDFPASVLDMTLMGAAGWTKSGLFGARNLWPNTPAARRKALAVLELVGIADLADNPVHALSGGQRQRMMVARALMGRDESEPFLLLLDEPTASIDPYGKWCFFEFLDSLKALSA